MTCPDCATADLTNHHKDCRYHERNFQTGEEQIIEGMKARVKELTKALKELAEAEAAYRDCHDRLGAGHTFTGRAWDMMRFAGDRARKLVHAVSP